MCKGEAPIKAACLVFFTSLLHICTVTRWLRALVTAGKAEGCTGETVLSRHIARELLSLRTTPKTRHFIECRVQSALQSVECRVQCADSRVRHDVQYTLFCLFRHGGGRYPVISL